jgi:hypothetical protein
MANQIKISVNKLGEYMTADPSRRKRIIADQKKPKGFIVNRYSIARRAIVDYFVHQRGDKREIERLMQSLIFEKYDTDFKRSDCILSIEALSVFKNNVTFNEDVFNFNFEKFKNFESNRLDVSGVSVSIRPEVIISGKMRGKPFIGAIKIHFSKTNPLDKEAGSFISTLLYQYLIETYPDMKVRHDFCFSLDVFSSTIITAPKNYARKWAQIKDACEEIKIRWNYL